MSDKIEETIKNLQSYFEKLLVAQHQIIDLCSHLEKNDIAQEAQKQKIWQNIFAEFPSAIYSEFDNIYEGIVSVANNPNAKNNSSPNSSLAAALSKHGVRYLAFISRIDETVSSESFFNSMLTKLISDFEMCINEVVVHLYDSFPEEYHVQQNQPFSWKDLEEHRDIDTFKKHLIQKSILDKMYKGFPDYLSLLKPFGFSDIKMYHASLTSYDIKEVFQRRNIIIHNDGKVSKSYNDKLLKFSEHSLIAEGTKLVVDSSYINKSADTLFFAAMAIYSTLIKEIVKNPKDLSMESPDLITKVSYNLLTEKRYSLLRTLKSNEDLYAFASTQGKEIIQVNHWLSLKEQGKLMRQRGKVAEWEPSNPLLSMAKSIILGNTKEAERAIINLLESGEINIYSVMLWPLFKSWKRSDKTENQLIDLFIQEQERLLKEKGKNN